MLMMRIQLLCLLLTLMVLPRTADAEETLADMDRLDLPPVSFQVMLGGGPLWTDVSERMIVSRHGAVGLISLELRFTKPYGIGFEFRTEVRSGWRELDGSTDPWGLSRTIEVFFKPYMLIRVTERKRFRLSLYISPPFFRPSVWSLQSHAFAPDGGKATSWEGHQIRRGNGLRLSATLGLDPDILVGERWVIGCRLRAEAMSGDIRSEFEEGDYSPYALSALLVVGWRKIPHIRPTEVHE